ncbi:MAG: HNH endonuclease [Methanobrevibacter sp.]|nr:HNH endonuclease [Methanobrevibacter sp.]
MTKIKQIDGFLDYYITDFGDVYSITTNKYSNHKGIKTKLKPFLSKNGYLTVSFGHKSTKRLVHRLVAKAFIPNPDNKAQVNHIDGNKTNNNVSNLEWCTCSENLIHKHRVLGHKGAWFGKFGKNNPSSKPVIQLKNNKIINKFDCIAEAERMTGISHSSISACCKNKSKTAGGYEWEYDLKGIL